jgi:hypothetical protein
MIPASSDDLTRRSIASSFHVNQKTSKEIKNDKICSTERSEEF